MAVAVWNYFFVGKMEQKPAIWCLKRKSLNINLFPRFHRQGLSLVLD